MKRLFLFFVAFSSLFSVYAQGADNLQALVDAYHRAIGSHNPDSIAFSCYHLSDYYSYRDADSTKKYCLQGLDYADKDKAEPYIYLLNNLGYYYSSVGDSRQSINQLLRTWSESDRLQVDNVTKGDILSSVGVGYRRINMVDSALHYYNAALTQYRKDESAAVSEIPFLLSNIAVLYANTSRLDEAESFVRQAVHCLNDSIDIDTRMYVSNTAGAIFMLQQKDAEAESIMLSSLRWARSSGKSRFILQCISPLLSLYHRTNNRTSLDRLVLEAQPILATFPEHSNEVLGFQETLAVIYYQDKRYAESVQLYLKQLAAHNKSSQTPLENIYLGLARNYTKMNRTSLASDYYEKAYSAVDSIYHSDIDEKMSEFTVKYDTQQKELEIARLNEERLQQKALLMQWSLIAASVVLILVLLLAYEVFRRKQQHQKAELDIARSFIDGLEKERTRLAKELHDGISNDLLGIGMMLNIKERDEETSRAIAQSVESVRAEVRAISHQLTPPKFQHTLLHEMVQHQLHEIFHHSGISLSFQSEGTLQQWSRIPAHISFEVYRIIQELSSNISLHSGASFVRVSMTVDDHSLQFLIVNDGKEFSPQQYGSHSGIGLSTLRERVKTINASFSLEYVDGAQQGRLHVSWPK